MTKRYYSTIFILILVLITSSSARIKELNKNTVHHQQLIHVEQHESISTIPKPIDTLVPKSNHIFKSLDNDLQAEKLGRLSMYFGIGAIVSLLAPIFSILALPLAIGAISFGIVSNKKGYKKNIYATLGISFGVAVIAIFMIAIAVVISVIANIN